MIRSLRHAPCRLLFVGQHVGFILLLVALAPLTSVTASPTPSVNVTVTAAVETQPVPHSGDAADDAAIWRDPTDPGRSTVIGTDKQGGLAVYDLTGKQFAYYDDSTPNNVDLRDGFALETTVSPWWLQATPRQIAYEPIASIQPHAVLSM